MDVAMVGAGLAGLVAAVELHERGHSIDERWQRLAFVYRMMSQAGVGLPAEGMAAMIDRPIQPRGHNPFGRLQDDSGVWICGDHRTDPSINGAVVSGRAGASAIGAAAGT